MDLRLNSSGDNEGNRMGERSRVQGVVDNDFVIDDDDDLVPSNFYHKFI